jgi:hypothetical protein
VKEEKEEKEVQDVEELKVILETSFAGRGPGRAGIFDFNRDIRGIPFGGFRASMATQECLWVTASAVT